MGNNISTSTPQYSQQVYDDYISNIPQIDPYEVFGLRENFTLEELKQAYRRLVILVHPDKGGSEPLFQAVTEAFKKLYNDWKMRESNKMHHELKQNSHEFLKSQYDSGFNSLNINGDAELVKGGAFQDRFNRLFDQYREPDEEKEIGYGNKMAQSTKEREDIKLEKAFDKYDETRFHQRFEKVVKPSTAIVHYEDPEPLVLVKKLQYTEMGKVPNDFSSDTRVRTNVQFMDYMKAHDTQRLINPSVIEKRKDFKTVDDYESYRETKAKQQLSPEELYKLQQKKQREEREEQDRIRRLQEKDRITSQRYGQIQQIMMQKLAR